MQRISLTRGLFAFVDDEDFDLVNRHIWHANESSNKPGSFTAAATNVRIDGRWTGICMHRLVLGLTKGDRRQVDHRNRNTLDNRRKNLRIATPAENLQNRRPWMCGAVPFKGVCFEKGKYRTTITAHGVRHNVGSFTTAEDAARAYDARAQQLHGEFAFLNFPQQ